MIAVYAVPFALNTRPAREWIVEKAKSKLGAGSLELASITFSWTEPTVLTGFSLRDDKGKGVIKAETIRWDRNLRQLITGFPKLGTLTLDRPAIDIERNAEGKIDLHEILRPLLGQDPRIELTIVSSNGTFSFWTDELTKPLQADHFDSRIEIASEPTPISWKAQLSNWPPGKPLEALRCEGHFDPWRANAGESLDLEIIVSGERWPCSVVVAKPAGIASARFEGTLTASWKDGHSKLTGDGSLLGVIGEGLDLYGFNVEATDVRFHATEGKIRFEPIVTKLNSGVVHLEPELWLDDFAGLELRLDSKSWVKDVDVNDKVSKRVLEFIAPVLGGASQVRGKVSASVVSASVPLGKGTRKDIRFDGAVQFQNVRFTAGSFAMVFLELAGINRQVGLRLDDEVSIAVANERVRARGLSVQLGKITTVEIDGWVDFDKNLEMTANVALTPALVANRPVLSSILEGTKLPVPIRGTLDQPELDLAASKFGLIDLGSTLIQKSVTKGLPGLFFKLLGPGQPDPDKEKEPEP